MSRLMPASTPQNASQIKDVHDRTSSWGQVTHSESWYKGYGFIQPQGGGRDVFVRISAVERAGLSTLNEGQQIEYEIEENRGKTSAVNLKVK
jgi:cold shock protein